ncbi:MAG TPA: DUF6717 family protein [Methylomirabilota bacterium]|nr:DUF6717 family protein [Methylomirabilota bacterium]
MNSIFVIAPYKLHGSWVFDDPAVGLKQEPFVSGADVIIDRLVANIPNAHEGFKLLFAPTPFPGHQLKVVRTREEYGGNWYRAESLNLEGWLCPALFKYFKSAPNELYVRAEPKS